jgi:hypothetical protein
MVVVAKGWVSTTSPPPTQSRRRVQRWRSNLTAANAGAAPFADHDGAAANHLSTRANPFSIHILPGIDMHCPFNCTMHSTFIHSFAALLYLALAAINQSCISD